MSKLRWEEQAAGGWYAYSGDLVVGMVVTVAAGPRKGLVTYSVSAVSTRWITRGQGDVKTIAQGKRSLLRAWSDWCARAGLVSAQ